MKSPSARTPRRASPAPRARAPARKLRSTLSKAKPRKAEGLASLLEHGQSIAQTVLTKSRISGLVGLAPSLVTAVGGYARREPVKAAGMALGVGGLFYLGRVLFRQPGIESSSPIPEPIPEPMRSTPQAGAGVPLV